MKSTRFETFCKYWHASIIVLHLIGGVAFMIGHSIAETGSISMGFLLGVAGCVLGTLCFFILPVFFIVISAFVRFAPIIAFPVFLVMLIGNLLGDNNFTQFSVKESFYITLLGSIWGTFNLWTALAVRKMDPKFNPIWLIEEK